MTLNVATCHVHRKPAATEGIGTKPGLLPGGQNPVGVFSSAGTRVAGHREAQGAVPTVTGPTTLTQQSSKGWQSSAGCGADCDMQVLPDCTVRHQA